MINGLYKYYESFVYVGTVNSYVLSAASAGNADSSAAASVTTDSDAPYGYCYDHRLFVSAEALEIGTDWDGLYGGSVTINGGTVIAKGLDCGIGAGKGGNITINDGDVTAIGGVTEGSTR